MILTCIHNRGRELAEAARPSGDFPDSEYPVTIGQTYPCLGIGLWEKDLLFLLPADSGYPYYVPAALFEVSSMELPDGWKFALRSGIRASDPRTDPLQAIWGYPELIDDPSHTDALMEADPTARQIFAQRVEEAKTPQNPPLTEPFRIPIRTLRQASNLLLDNLERTQGSDIVLDWDFFWEIARHQRYDVHHNPNEYAVGQTSESMEHLDNIVNNPDLASRYALVWLADVLRSCGDQNPGHAQPER